MLIPAPRNSTERWHTSSHSGPNGACVEVASLASVPATTTDTWRTSHHGGTNGECVEVADLPTSVAMRDSKHPTLGHLRFPRNEWAALLAGIRNHEL